MLKLLPVPASQTRLSRLPSRQLQKLLLITISLLLTTSALAADPTTKPKLTRAAERHQHQAYLEQPIQFETFVFSTDAFPKFDFKDQQKVKELIGPYTLTAKFFKSTYEPVDEAKTPGRYGAIITVTTEQGPVYERRATLFRLAANTSWYHVKFKTATTLPVESGIDSSITARQAHAIEDFANWNFRSGMNHEPDAAILLAWLFEIPANAPENMTDLQQSLAESKWWFGLEQKLGLPGYRFELYKPAAYSKQPETKWPLIVFLHGSGQNGDRTSYVYDTGLPNRLQHNKDFPFVVLMPQTPYFADWNPWKLDKLLDRIAKENHVDENRIYLTGLSSGGYGSFEAAYVFPKRFAAVAPISSFFDVKDISALKDVPMWIFAGENDYSFKPDLACVAALKELHADVQFTSYPNMGHDVWTKTYADQKLFDWFLEHHN